MGGGVLLYTMQSEFYDIWAAPNEVGYAGHFATRDEKVHSERRRIVNQVYSMSSILESEPEIDDCTRVFIEATRTFAQQKTAVDLGPWLTKCVSLPPGKRELGGRSCSAVRERERENLLM